MTVRAKELKPKGHHPEKKDDGLLSFPAEETR
jgi:hypothetical protein